MNILIKNGLLTEADKEIVKADILIQDGRITKVAPEIGEEYVSEQGIIEIQEFDATGFHVFPGLVDAHCHLRDPGQEHREDIASGTRSAAAGGFTDIACMPNTAPVIDNKTVVHYIKDKAARVGVVRVHPIGAITKGLDGVELSEMGALKEAGIVAVSDDGKPVSDSSVMRKAVIYASQFGLRVISHCEDASMADGGAMNEGAVSTRLGLRGIPNAAEDIMVSRELILAESTGIAVHIAHVSSALSVELIRSAKQRGVKVTAETCPHYFTLTDEACLNYDTNAKMNPPLRTFADLLAVREGLRDKTLSIIATDHAPHHEDEKRVEFEKANNGIVGFETALPLAVTFLVNTGILTLNDVARCMSKAPAAMLGLPEKRLEAGYPADITILDTNASWTVDSSKLASKSKNTPFHGWVLSGMIKLTVVGGNIVAKDGKAID